MNDFDDRDIKKEILMVFFQRQLEAGKWLLGSLLVVNGGAVLAFLSKPEILNNIDGSFLLFFLLGIIFAFISGSLSWLSSDIAILLLRKKLNIYYHDGDEKLTGIRAHKHFHGFVICFMWIFSALSLLFFITGCYYVYKSFL